MDYPHCFVCLKKESREESSPKDSKPLIKVETMGKKESKSENFWERIRRAERS